MPSVVELHVIQGVAEVAMDNPPYQTPVSYTHLTLPTMVQV